MVLVETQVVEIEVSIVIIVDKEINIHETIDVVIEVLRNRIVTTNQEKVVDNRLYNNVTEIKAKKAFMENVHEKATVLVSWLWNYYLKVLNNDFEGKDLRIKDDY